MTHFPRFLVALASGLVALGAALASADVPEAATVTAIEVEGLEATKEYVVLREIASRVGEPFRGENLKEDRKRLDRLRIFSSIDVRAEKSGEDVVIRIVVEETLAYLPTLSLEVNDENGVSAGPGLKSVNLFGRAIELSASARFGGATNAEVFFRDPWVTGNHLSYQVQYFRRDRENALDDFQELAHELEIRLGSFVGQSGRVGGLFSFMDVASDRSGVTLSHDGSDRLPGLGVFLGYDTRDLWSNPGRGFWNEVQISKTGGFLGGPADYWGFVFDVRRFQPLGDGRTLALSSLTSLQTGEVGVGIPLHQDFHVGGTNSIRGWSLSSRVGKHQLLNTVELRQTLAEPASLTVAGFTAYIGLQVAGFVDFGHAWSRPDELALDRFITGYGAGLRLLVPFVDVVRLDVGFGEPGEGPTFHFGIFPKVVMQRARVR